VKKEKKAIVQILSKRYDILFGYLFGSKAKGYANERSDWDIALYINTSIKQNGRWPEFELEAQLSRAVKATVQVTILNTPLPPVFAFEILKDGILLIDRGPNLRMDFENKILRHYYDWQYFLNRQMEAERYRSRIWVA
jgi:predicted nucleotidyltransferase